MASPERDPLFDGDSDSDISVNSTVPDEGEEFPVEKILAEDEGDDGEPQYLIKWEGYGLHDCTWEPVSNFMDKAILDDWRDQKMHATRGGLQAEDGRFYKDAHDYIQSNIIMVERAWAKAQEERDVRHQKRRQKRIKLGLSVSPEPMTEDEDESFQDPQPLTVSKPKPTSSAPLPIAKDDDNDNDEDSDQPIITSRPKTMRRGPQPFIEEDGDDEDQAASSLFVRKPRFRRALTDELSDDPLQEELKQKKSTLSLQWEGPKKASNEVNRQVPSTINTPTLNKAPKPTNETNRKPVDSGIISTARRVAPPTATRAVPPAKDTLRPPPRPTATVTGAANTTQQKRPVLLTPSTKLLASTVAHTRPAKGAPVPAQSSRPPGQPSAPIMKRTAASTPGIKMNMSGIAPPKKERKQSTKPFKSLSHQHNAQKLAGQEGIPDPKVLEFVDPAAPSRRFSGPATVGTTFEARSTTTNSYALRPDSEALTPKQSDETWNDKHKEQVTCFEWRNGTCHFGDADCRFLHRNVEYTSEDWARVAHSHGVPLTCWYWWNHDSGCTREPRECKFAHWNTGLVANRQKNKSPMEVDKFDLPRRETSYHTPGVKTYRQGHQSARKVDKLDLPRRETPVHAPRAIPCHFWAQGYCRFAGDHLPFVHHQIETITVQSDGFNRPLVASKYARANTLDPALKTSPLISNIPAPPLNQPTVRFNYPSSTVVETPLNITEDVEIPEAIKVRLLLPQSTHGDAEEVEVQLMGLNAEFQNEVRSAIGANTRLRITHNCTAVDWKEYCNEPRVDGQVTVGDVIPLSSSHDLLEKYASILKQKGSLGAVISFEKYTMILYTAGQEAWNYLNEKSYRDSPYMAIRKMRFHVRSLVPHFDASSSTEDTSSSTDIQSKLEEELKLNPLQLFDWHDGALDRNVFLFFEEQYRELIDRFTRCLQGMDAVVYHYLTPGAWDYFRRHTKSGVIIFHPDVYLYGNLTGIRHFLLKRYNFFQVGAAVYDVDKYENRRRLGILTPYDIPPWVSQSKKLFPNGSLTLITDDVFVHQPIEAWHVVEAFIKFRPRKQPSTGIPRHKLVARPALVPWLLNLIRDNEGESADRHEARKALFLAFRDYFCAPEFLDRSYDGALWVPNKLSQLISLHPNHLPSYQDQWEKNQLVATDGLVRYLFSPLCCRESEFHRRFIVCHTFRMETWLEKYAHLSDVVGPADCIRKYINPK